MAALAGWSKPSPGCGEAGRKSRELTPKAEETRRWKLVMANLRMDNGPLRGQVAQREGRLLWTQEEGEAVSSDLAPSLAAAAPRDPRGGGAGASTIPFRCAHQHPRTRTKRGSKIVSKEGLRKEIRKLLESPVFSGERSRRFWVRLRHQGARTSEDWGHGVLRRHRRLSPAQFVEPWPTPLKERL